MYSRARNIIIGSLILLLTACGQQYKAEKAVEVFIEANAIEPSEISKRDFADVGTTRHISDSLIDVMRHRGAPLYKKEIAYPEKPQGDLIYLRMRYVHQGDTLQNTFYLDPEAQNVIAFK